MPGLNDGLHLRMLATHTRLPRFLRRVYGLEWGNPEKVPYLKLVRTHYLSFFLDPHATVVEIGPGGGRWTRYMMGVKTLYAVDYHPELLDEMARTCRGPNLLSIKNNGDDFPGIPDSSVDFVFSFGCFVHLDLDIIQGYLDNLHRILTPRANVVIHYADKTKPLAQRHKAFSENTPEIMLRMIRDSGFTVQDDNRWLMPHSAIVRFTPRSFGAA